MFSLTGHRSLIVRSSLHNIMLEIAGSSPGCDLSKFFPLFSDSVILIIAMYLVGVVCRC